jgi:hypothetical protein
MLKTSLAKWALAAMMAVPAVPMFGKTIHHKLVVHRTTHHSLMSLSTTHRHTLTHKTVHHVTYSTHRRSLTHKTTAHKLTHKSTVRHTSLSSSPKFKVHVTKMPPTIDGINA